MDNLHTTTQKVCAWSGLAGMLIFFLGLVIAQFFPPPSPSLSPEAVAAIYQENATGIRIGMILLMASGVLTAPFVALISIYMRRIEGNRTPVLAYSQLVAGAAGIIFFVVPGVFFLMTAFRPDRPIEITYMLNDFSWIMTVIPWPPAFMQCILIGAVILKDKSTAPIFPRWLGYLNFWIAVLFLPGSLLAFFYSGPFAWNGLFPFWVAGGVFGTWYIAMLVMLLKAINQEALEGAGQDSSMA